LFSLNDFVHADFFSWPSDYAADSGWAANSDARVQQIFINVSWLSPGAQYPDW
jgi:hypothetical protein